jgi:hypothetical protein
VYVFVCVYVYLLHCLCLTIRLNARVCESNYSKAANGRRVGGGEVRVHTDRDNVWGEMMEERKIGQRKFVLLPSPLSLA